MVGWSEHLPVSRLGVGVVITDFAAKHVHLLPWRIKSKTISSTENLIARCNWNALKKSPSDKLHVSYYRHQDKKTLITVTITPWLLVTLGSASVSVVCVWVPVCPLHPHHGGDHLQEMVSPPPLYHRTTCCRWRDTFWVHQVVSKFTVFTVSLNLLVMIKNLTTLS